MFFVSCEMLQSYTKCSHNNRAYSQVLYTEKCVILIIVSVTSKYLYATKRMYLYIMYFLRLALFKCIFVDVFFITAHILYEKYEKYEIIL